MLFLFYTFVFFYTDNINLNEDIIPFFICHWGKCTHSRKMSSLFQVSQGWHSSYSDADTGKAFKREKPVDLYERLIAMYDSPHSWILDLCSGAGNESEWISALKMLKKSNTVRSLQFRIWYSIFTYLLYSFCEPWLLSSKALPHASIIVTSTMTMK